MNTTLEYLFHVDSPYIYLGLGEPERQGFSPSHFYARRNMSICVRHLRGRKMRTAAGLMDEFGAALQFFDGFGENWHALGECLEYLDEWMPAEAYVLVVGGAEELLRDEQPEQLEAFLKTLHDAGEWWSKPVVGNGRFDRNAIPFHVLLHVTEDEPSATYRLSSIANRAHIPLRQ